MTEPGVDGAVGYEETNGYGLITLDRPSRKNAFNTAQYDGVRDALDLAMHSTVRSVIITGAGSAFSAGADITEWANPPDLSDGKPHGFTPFIDRISTFNKPLIAAVNGVAVGIGVTLLFHCDFVLASPEARFRTPFVSLGILPEAGSSILGGRQLGRQGAANLLLRGAWLTAEEALAAGLVSELVDDDLLDAAKAIAEDFAALPLRPLQMAKQLLLDAETDSFKVAFDREMAANAQCAGSDANREAIAAFMEKRPADFAQFD